MIEAIDLKYGKVIKVEDTLYFVIEAHHVKKAQRRAFIKAKLKHILQGNVIERTFRSDEEIEDVYVERKNMQFLFKSGNEWTFMDTENFEQIVLTEDLIGDKADLIKEGQNLIVLFYNEKPIGIELPPSVELKVASTEPGVKGDTVSTPMKPAILETGLKVMVPLFIKEGDVLKIDTETKSYIERV